MPSGMQDTNDASVAVSKTLNKLGEVTFPKSPVKLGDRLRCIFHFYLG